MKKILTIFLYAVIFQACDSSKKNSSSIQGGNPLTGSWSLVYITGPRISFDGLFPDKKPFVSFDTVQQRISGHTSCNRFSGPYLREGNNISFREPLIMTRMMCASGAQGETTFIFMLNKTSGFHVKEDTLVFSDSSDIMLMKFIRSKTTNTQN